MTYWKKWEANCESYARRKRMYYLALVKEGFKPGEAIRIVASATHPNI